MDAILWTILLFGAFLLANLLLLSTLWIIFLNIGIFEAPNESHWANKLVLIRRNTPLQLPWALNFPEGGVAGSAQGDDLFHQQTIQAKVDPYVVAAWDENEGSLFRKSAQSEPQTICAIGV